MQNGKIVDLHVHSTKSDGSLTPAQLVDYAIEKGLSAFALTDHDTTDGVKEAELAAKGKGIKVIPGIEFSSEYEGKDIHIVGLYIDYESDFFKRRLVSFVKGREVRNREMCRRLTEHGMPVAYEELTKAFPGCVITRGHFATYLLEHGYVKSRKEAFDRSGLVYGIGHAIYSVSDPRARIFKEYVSKLAAEKGRSDEFMLYSSVETIAPQVIGRERNMYKGVSANVDFYSGFVYQMLGLPRELFTPLFAIARIAGWSSHRLEELINGNKIIRPAYLAVSPRKEYTPMQDR